MVHTLVPCFLFSIRVCDTLNKMLKIIDNSRLDQGLNEIYSCPTCRKPLFVGRPENEAHPHNEETSSDEQLARQISSGLDRQNSSGHTLPTGVFPNQTQNPAEGPWRYTSLLMRITLVPLSCYLVLLNILFCQNDIEIIFAQGYCCYILMEDDVIGYTKFHWVLKFHLWRN